MVPPDLHDVFLERVVVELQGKASRWWSGASRILWGCTRDHVGHWADGGGGV